MTRSRPSMLIALLLALVAALTAAVAASSSGDERRGLTDVRPLGGGGGEGRLVVEDLEVNVAISSHSISVFNTTDIGGGGGGTGKAEFSEITVRKRIDKASPVLLRAVASGVHAPTAVVTVFRPGTTTPQAVYELQNVVISGIAQAGTKGNSETVSIDYGTLTLTAGGESTCWDLVGNVGC